MTQLFQETLHSDLEKRLTKKRKVMSLISMKIMDLRRELGRMKRVFLRKRESRWGQDFLQEVHERVPQAPQVIFDVGGHRGESALKFSDAFPKARVYTFEPSVENFEEMKAVLSGKPSIKRLNLAIGSFDGVTKFSHNKHHSSMSRIEGGPEDFREVNIKMLDTFAHENKIAVIDILKIDTEGHEMEVLRGAGKLFDESRIGLVRIECGLDPDEHYHVNFREVLDFLEPKGFRIFGIYEQWENVFDPKSKLSRADIVLASQKLWSVMRDS